MTLCRIQCVHSKCETHTCGYGENICWDYHLDCPVLSWRSRDNDIPYHNNQRLVLSMASSHLLLSVDVHISLGWQQNEMDYVFLDYSKHHQSPEKKVQHHVVYVYVCVCVYMCMCMCMFHLLSNKDTISNRKKFIWKLFVRNVEMLVDPKLWFLQYPVIPIRISIRCQMCVTGVLNSFILKYFAHLY